MASGREFLRQYRAALAAKARQQRIARQRWQRAAPQLRAGMNRKPPQAEDVTVRETGEQQP